MRGRAPRGELSLVENRANLFSSFGGECLVDWNVVGLFHEVGVLSDLVTKVHLHFLVKAGLMSQWYVLGFAQACLDGIVEFRVVLVLGWNTAVLLSRWTLPLKCRLAVVADLARLARSETSVEPPGTVATVLEFGQKRLVLR